MHVFPAEDAETTTNHWWWRPGWGVGVRYYTWHLTFEDAPELHDRAAQLRPALASHPTQDLIPDEWLHLTMTGVGFIEDVTPAQLDEVVARVEQATHGFDWTPLVFDDVLVGTEGTLMPARTAPWLDGLAEAQRRAVDGVLGTHEWGTFWPHVTLAYASGEEPIAGILDDLAPVAAPLPELVVRRPRISLIEIHRDNRQYQWRVMRQLQPHQG